MAATTICLGGPDARRIDRVLAALRMQGDMGGGVTRSRFVQLAVRKALDGVEAQIPVEVLEAAEHSLEGE